MKALKWFLLAIIVGTLPSCMTIDSVINVKPDGSGTVVDKIVLKPAAKQMLEGLGDAAGGASPLLDEAAYKQRAETLGAEFVSVKKIEGEDDGVEVTYKFADIANLKFVPSEGASPSGGAGDDSEQENPITFEFTAGDPAKLKVKLPDDFHDIKSSAQEAGGGDEADAEGADELSDQMMAMMAPMFKDMKMRVRMHFEDEIVKTDATVSKGNDVIIMFIDFGKVVGTEGGLKKLMETDGSDRDAINTMPGVMLQLKDEFEVTFK